MRRPIAPALVFILALGLCAFSKPGPQIEQPKANDPRAGLYHCEAGARSVRDADIVLFNPATRRDLSLRVVYPASGGGPLPVIIWSHGAFGSGKGYAPLTRFWASHGYVVIAPTHADSAENGTWPSLANAAAFREWNVRPRELSFIIDRLGKISRLVPGLAGRLDAGALGVGGHSFGAHTAELVAGASVRGRFVKERDRGPYSDPRPAAFMMISPTGPGGVFDVSSFTDIRRPVLVVSGDNDTVGRMRQSASARRKAWELMPDGDKYLLWIAGGYHGFGGIAGSVRFEGSGPMDGRHVDYVRCTGLAFWDLYLRNRTGARTWLDDEKLAGITGGAAVLDRK